MVPSNKANGLKDSLLKDTADTKNSVGLNGKPGKYLEETCIFHETCALQVSFPVRTAMKNQQGHIICKWLARSQEHATCVTFKSHLSKTKEKVSFNGHVKNNSSASYYT